MSWIGGIAGVVAVLFGVAAALAIQHRNKSGTVAYVGMLSLLGVIAGVTAGGELGLLSELTVVRVLIVSWLVASTLWAIFVIKYTGRGPVLTRFRTGGLLGFALLTAGLSVGASVYQLSGGVPSLVLTPLQLAVLSLAVFGVILIARAGVTYADLPLGRSLALTGGGIMLTLIYALGIVIDVLGIDPAFGIGTGVLATSAVSFLLAQFRYGLFESDPTTGHLAREKVLDEMSACVLLADREQQLLDVNDAAVETFGLDRRQSIGKPLERVVGASLEGNGEMPSTLETAVGQREFSIRRSSLTRTGVPVGTIYILRDVTEQRTHEQRLEVLNRVLRHNLRNDLDAIRAFAETLKSDGGAGAEPDRVAARLERTAREVAEIGSGVARAERILSDGGPDREPVEVRTLATRVAESSRVAFPDASIEVAGPELTVPTDPRVLETVLEELVENAVQHNDGEEPSVEIRLAETERGIDLSVRDNGPGIPDHDLTVLLDGEETPLHHGTGLGLWLVYWGVKRLGGQLRFDVDDPGGSVVRISLPVFSTVRDQAA